MVRRIFMQHDAKEILKIRLPKFKEDFISRTLEKHGMFSLRSAYYFAQWRSSVLAVGSADPTTFLKTPLVYTYLCIGPSYKYDLTP